MYMQSLGGAPRYTRANLFEVMCSVWHLCVVYKYIDGQRTTLTKLERNYGLRYFKDLYYNFNHDSRSRDNNQKYIN